MIRNIVVGEQAKDIRALARNSLNGNWGKVFIAYFIYYILQVVVVEIFNSLFPLDLLNNNLTKAASAVAVNEVASAGSIPAALYTVLCSGALTLGLCMFFINFVRKSDIKNQYLLFGFEYFLKALGLNIVYGAVVLIGTILFVIPGIVFGIEYGQAFYILADDPSKKVFQCMRESRIMMENNKGRYFYLDLTFIGWSLLASIPSVMIGTLIELSDIQILEYTLSLVLSIPLMFVTIYQETAHTNFYELASGHLIKEIPMENVAAESSESATESSESATENSESATESSDMKDNNSNIENN